jgi:isopentenyldiphosphate isomerase
MEELFDVVNEENEVIGSALRKEVHSKGHIHRSVLFFIFDNDGRVFVNQRTENKEFYPGYWSIVFGGHVHSGESYEEAVVRELKEEAGIEEKPELMASFKKRFDELDKENVRVYAIVTGKRLEIDPEEIKQGEFVTMGELEKKLKKEKFLPETQMLVGILGSYGR